MSNKAKRYNCKREAVASAHYHKVIKLTLVASGKIVAKPLAFIRGVTFSNSFIILDEAQNTTPEQMKLFLISLGRVIRLLLTEM